MTEAKNSERKSRLRRNSDRLALRPALGAAAVVRSSSTAVRKRTAVRNSYWTIGPTQSPESRNDTGSTKRMPTKIANRLVEPTK